MHRAMQDCLANLETSMAELLQNFPNKALGISLRVLMMPYGKKYNGSSDKLDHTIATMLQTPCEARTRLGSGQYVGRDEGNPMGELEQILDDVLAAEPLYEKICEASGERLPFTQLDLVAAKGLELNIITDQDAILLRRAEKGRLKTINVDDFDPEELVVDKSVLKPKRKSRTKAA